MSLPEFQLHVFFLLSHTTSPVIVFVVVCDITSPANKGANITTAAPDQLPGIIVVWYLSYFILLSYDLSSTKSIQQIIKQWPVGLTLIQIPPGGL